MAGRGLQARLGLGALQLQLLAPLLHQGLSGMRSLQPGSCLLLLLALQHVVHISRIRVEPVGQP